MFEIKVNGKPVRQYRHTDGNLYIEGKKGTEYSISLNNNSYERRLYVISVDGINVISGKPATEDDINGYVINGYSSLNLKGFRINDNDVAAFKFVDAEKSYAKDVTDSKQNCGVIGVKVYSEKKGLFLGDYNCRPYKPYKKSWPEYPDMPEYPPCGNKPEVTWTTSDNTTAGGIGGNQIYCCTLNQSNVLRSMAAVADKSADFDIGTGWGAKQTQAVVEVEFEVDKLIETQLLYYATRTRLEAMGVQLTTQLQMPSAFGEKKYCQIPKGWTG